MNSRERVLATIEHREPDRIPIDLGGTPSSGISALAYTNLKEYLKIKTGHTQVYDVVQQLAQPEEDFLARFHVDVVDIGRTFNASEGDWYPIQIHGKELHYPQWFKPRRNLDGSYDVLDREVDIIAHMPANGYFFDQSYYPYREGYPADFRDLPKVMTKILWQTLAHSPWDHAGDPKFWDTLRSRAISLRKSSNRAIMIACGCNLFEWGTFLRGLDHFLVDLVKQPAQVERLLDALMEQHLASLEKVCKAVGDVVDILRFGDDLGTNDRSFMRPEIYRRLFKPRHTILCQYVKKHSRMHTFLHSCGAIAELLPDLIDVGYEILNPVQINCEGMDPVGLKQKFGAKLTFWGGGADTRNVMVSASPKAVKTHVTQLLQIFSPGGGYVFNPVHNLLPDVPPQNIMAMFEAVEEFNVATKKK